MITLWLWLNGSSQNFSDNAEVTRAGLATSCLPESTHTQISYIIRGASPRWQSARFSNPCPAVAARCEPKYHQSKTDGNGSDTAVEDQDSEANFAADLWTFARIPTFYKLLGLQGPPQCITHPYS